MEALTVLPRPTLGERVQGSTSFPSQARPGQWPPQGPLTIFSMRGAPLCLLRTSSEAGGTPGG